MIAIHPIPYTPAVEKPEPDEAETGRALVETMHGIAKKTLADGGHALRSVHAKSHGLLEGELEISGDLPEPLAQGLFAAPGRHPVIMRFSTVPGDILDDSVSTPRGLAIKIFDVAGARLSGSEADRTQDFVLVNGPAFSAPNAKAFLANLKLLAKTTDHGPGLKTVLSAALRGVQHAVVAGTGAPSPTISALGGQLPHNILGETFFSQVPVRYGAYIAKVSVAPASPELQALTGQPVDLSRPNALRDAVVDFFRMNGGTWAVRVQLCTNLETMPVEDASAIWPEDQSPQQVVGRITVKPQAAWSEARAAAVDDGLSFSPWHGLAAHQPLGSIMRVRKAAYEMGRQFRAEGNGRTIGEPASKPVLPS